MSLIHKNYVHILQVLYDYGILSARDLSEATGIDRTNIYDYLETLNEVGWVIKERGSLMDISNTYKYRLSPEGQVFLEIYPNLDELRQEH